MFMVNRFHPLGYNPSGEVLAFLLLPKRVFKCQFLYVWKSFCEVGLSQLLCMDWLLVWNVVSSEAGLSSVSRLRSGHLGMCYLGAICALSKAISEAISDCAASTGPHRSLGLQWWAIPSYFCLIR